MCTEQRVLSSAALCKWLAELLEESKAFLAHADPSVEQWAEYSRRRASLFAQLQTGPWHVSAEAQPRVRQLLEELRLQEEIVRERAAATLSGIRAAMQLLASARQAQREYAFPSPPSLLRCCV